MTQITQQRAYFLLSYGIALVWIINGLFCKMMGFVPRHEQIVAAILGSTYARLLTFIIGFLEIGMSVWIITQIKSRLNTIVQICVIALMNLLEFFLVPDLLLWGRLNIAFAGLFLIVLYFNEFHLNPKQMPTSH